MTHYALFIDESGSFGAEDRRESWIVGGLLTSMKFKDFETTLKEIVKPIQEKFNLTKINQFHATEIRSHFGNKGHDKVREVFCDLIEELNSLKETRSYFITTINHTKISSNNAERNYRLMLLDLIIQSEKLIEQNGDEITGFDLVIASRTIDRELQTDYQHIDDEIVKSLASAIESDLVAFGRLYLLGEKLKIYIESAKYNWGLIYADFLCNMTYNAHFIENKTILDNLKETGKLVSYQTFASPELRRILSHEANQNYSSAIFDCLRLLERKNNTEEVTNILHRILKTALIDSGTTGVKVNLDAILEKIWRDKTYFNNYEKRAKIFIKLSNHLSSLAETYQFKNLNEFQFQLKNLILLCYNHTANTIEAEKLVIEQEELIPSLIIDPSNYSMILDYYGRLIEIYVNSLKFDDAESRAISYKNMIDQYFEFWQLINSDINQEKSSSSSIFIRANSALIRLQVINFDGDDDTAKEIFDNIDSTLKVTHLSQDISRLKCQKIALLCKTKAFDKATELAFSNFENAKLTGLDISFDYFFLLYAVNQRLLCNKDEILKMHLITQIDSIIKEQESYNLDLEKYPAPIIYRELSIFNYLKGNVKLAKDRIKKSNELLNGLKADSETTKFLKLINRFYEKMLSKETLDFQKELEKLDLGDRLNFQSLGKDQEQNLFYIRSFITS